MATEVFGPGVSVEGGLRAETSPFAVLPERFPNGLYMPMGPLIALSKGSGRGNYTTGEPVDLLTQFYPLLVKYGFQIRGSTLADVAEFASQGFSSSSAISVLLHRQCYENFDWLRVANSFIKHPNESPWDPFTYLRKFVHSDLRVELQDMQARGLDGLVPQALGVFWDLSVGTDWDGVVDVEPQHLFEMAQEIARGAMGFVGGNRSITQEVDGNIRWIVDFPGEVLAASPKDDMYTVANPGFEARTPVIVVEYGRWENGIYYVDIGLNSYRGNVADRRLIASVGLQSSPSHVSTEYLANNTRLAPGKVHSWNTVLAKLKTHVPNPHGNYISEEGVISFNPEHGVMRHPLITGNWSEDTFIFPGNRKELIEGWIHLNPEQLGVFAQPIRLGEDFGVGRSVTTWLEFLRAQRYCLRYGAQLADNETTARAKCILRGEELVGGKPLWEHLRDLSESEREYWETEMMREGIVMLIYDAKRFVEEGNELGYGEYFPRWDMLARVVDALPSRKDVISGNRFAPLKIGEIAQLVRDGTDEDISPVFWKNDFLLLCWLLSWRK